MGMTLVKGKGKPQPFCALRVTQGAPACQTGRTRGWQPGISAIFGSLWA